VGIIADRRGRHSAAFGRRRRPLSGLQTAADIRTKFGERAFSNAGGTHCLKIRATRQTQRISERSRRQAIYGRPALHMRTSYILDLFLLLFSSTNLSGSRLNVCHTSARGVACGPSANLECTSEMCCTRLAGNAGPQKSPKFAMGTIAPLCRAISSQLRHVSTIIKKLVKHQCNISPTCPHSMVYFGPLTAEIRSGVLGTPANFNGFRVLAALLHGTLVVRVSQTLRR